ncbi:uncharacterized protein B0T15DRAFT_210526 [Chaetomium strumarium]|uniref:Uncharacterized protein n=1 Tax=Chaetomium strumarium TaxID=1170767 RepID=A0AAJ0M1S0_9PEZI|nr:hypothetical protein B0T15DRAFT_210526 [Chaetomium strumarium]
MRVALPSQSNIRVPPDAQWCANSTVNVKIAHSLSIPPGPALSRRVSGKKTVPQYPDTRWCLSPIGSTVAHPSSLISLLSSSGSVPGMRTVYILQFLCSHAGNANSFDPSTWPAFSPPGRSSSIVSTLRLRNADVEYGVAPVERAEDGERVGKTRRSSCRKGCGAVVCASIIIHYPLPIIILSSIVPCRRSNVVKGAPVRQRGDRVLLEPMLMLMFQLVTPSRV